jgi:hypothetical protein
VWTTEGQFRFERVQMTRSHAGPETGIAENPCLAAIGGSRLGQGRRRALHLGTGSVLLTLILSVLFLETELVEAHQRPDSTRPFWWWRDFLFPFPVSFLLGAVSPAPGKERVEDRAPGRMLRLESELRSFSEPNLVRRWWLFRCHWWGIECLIRTRRKWSHGMAKTGRVISAVVQDAVPFHQRILAILWQRGNGAAASRITTWNPWNVLPCPGGRVTAQGRQKL